MKYLVLFLAVGAALWIAEIWGHVPLMRTVWLIPVCGGLHVTWAWILGIVGFCLFSSWIK